MPESPAAPVAAKPVTPVTPGPSRRVGLLGLAVPIIAVAAGVGVVAAAGSLVGQRFADPQVAAAGVLASALALCLVVPAGTAALGMGRLRARGYKLKSARLGSAIVTLWNAALIGLLAWGAPTPLPQLVKERGLWVVDGLRGEGPFGVAAEPAVQRLVAQAREARHLQQAAPLLSSASAGAEAVQLVLMLDATRPVRSPEDSTTQRLDQLVGRWGLDPAALREHPERLAVDDGRALLADVLALAPPIPDTGSTWAWPSPLPDPVTLALVDPRTFTLAEPAGWEARYEDGAWRLHTGGVSDYAARLQRHLTFVRNAAGAQPSAAPLDLAAPAEVAAPAAPVDSPEQAAVRAALLASARGRLGWAAGTTAFAAEWAEALTRDAAVAQAERVRTWCARASSADPLFATDHAKLFTDWQLGPVAEVLPDPAKGQVQARGRRWLTDVVTLCAPAYAARQSADDAAGLAIPEARRMRWAELDAADQAASATITVDATAGSADIVFAGGATRRAVFEDGAWRVAWED